MLEPTVLQRLTLRQFLRFACPLAILAAGGCATPVLAPEPAESERLRTVQSGFHIDAREGTVRYTVRLEKTIAVGEPLFLTVRYENPADETDPHTEQLLWPPEEERLELSSPPLRSLEPNVFYLVSIDLFEDAARTESDETHEVFIFSTIDTRSYGR